MDENESASDSTSSTLTLSSVIDAEAKVKDGATTNVKEEPMDSTEKRIVNAQKLSDEVDKVCKSATEGNIYHCIGY